LIIYSTYCYRTRYCYRSHQSSARYIHTTHRPPRLHKTCDSLQLWYPCYVCICLYHFHHIL